MAAFRLRTVSNLLAAIREGDYSFRVRGGEREDAFGELVLELNLLAQTMREERYGDIESTALLGKVMAEIDVAVLAFSPERRLTLANRAAVRLVGAEGSAVDRERLRHCPPNRHARADPPATGLTGTSDLSRRRSRP